MNLPFMLRQAQHERELVQRFPSSRRLGGYTPF